MGYVNIRPRAFGCVFELVFCASTQVNLLVFCCFTEGGNGSSKSPYEEALDALSSLITTRTRANTNNMGDRFDVLFDYLKVSTCLNWTNVHGYFVGQSLDGYVQNSELVMLLQFLSIMLLL